MSEPGISVVIPNYNGRHLFPQTLPALIVALQNSGFIYEIIVSDDNSSDDSVIFLRQHYQSIIVLESDANCGFSPTINRGIFTARYEYILLLNSDVKLSENYFNSLLKYFDQQDTFGVMGRIVGWADDDIQDAAKYPGFVGAKIKTTGNYYLKQPNQKNRLYSMYLSGANAFVSKNKILQLGSFDELFAPFYVEDYELSLRAWRMGWKCYYEHFAICHHKTSASIKSKSSKKFINKIYYRNKMYLHALHLSTSQMFFWYLQLIPESLIRLFTFRFYYFASLELFFKNRKKILESKRRFLSLEKKEKKLLSINEVMRVIRSSIKQKDIIRF